MTPAITTAMAVEYSNSSTIRGNDVAFDDFTWHYGKASFNPVVTSAVSSPGTSYRRTVMKGSGADTN